MRLQEPFQTPSESEVEKGSALINVPGPFGADLGAEKFLDIKCRKAGLAPDLVVLVDISKHLNTQQHPSHP